MQYEGSVLGTWFLRKGVDGFAVLRARVEWVSQSLVGVTQSAQQVYFLNSGVGSRDRDWRN